MASMSRNISQLAIFTKCAASVCSRKTALRILLTDCKLMCRKAPLYEKTWLEVPSKQEVETLLQKFPNPREIIRQVLDPVMDLRQCVMPKVEYNEPSQKSDISHWKVQMTFQWPETFHVCGRSKNKEDAELNACLMACQMLMFIGLVKPQGQDCGSFTEYTNFEKALFENVPNVGSSVGVVLPWETLLVKTTANSVGGQTAWTCDIHINWPVDIEVRGKGSSRKQAKQNAAALALVKMKSKGLLGRFNKAMATVQSTLPGSQLIDHDNFQHDFKVYVDASQKGYGAYLYDHTCDSDGSVKWLQDEWPESIANEFVLNKTNSTFIEFYAMLTAVFTWKKKFQGRRILVCSDNMHVTDIVNHGMILSSTSPQSFLKLFKVLRQTCVQYKISLIAKHVPREQNEAADFLSKSAVEKFKELVPEAYHKAKKSKQLLFCLPLSGDKLSEKSLDEKSDNTNDSNTEKFDKIEPV